jgi:hypothetical protein
MLMYRKTYQLRIITSMHNLPLKLNYEYQLMKIPYKRVLQLVHTSVDASMCLATIAFFNPFNVLNCRTAAAQVDGVGDGQTAIQHTIQPATGSGMTKLVTIMVFYQKANQ